MSDRNFIIDSMRCLVYEQFVPAWLHIYILPRNLLPPTPPPKKYKWSLCELSCSGTFGFFLMCTGGKCVSCFALFFSVYMHWKHHGCSVWYQMRYGALVHSMIYHTKPYIQHHSTQICIYNRTYICIYIRNVKRNCYCIFNMSKEGS